MTDSVRSRAPNGVSSARVCASHVGGMPPNMRMQLTKPAQAMELRSWSAVSGRLGASKAGK